MHSRLALAPLLFAAACSYPRFESARSVDFTLPAGAIRELACESHNGGITVTGNAAATEIVVHVDITVRGHSQAEADANQNLLAVGREENGTRLRLFGKVDPQLSSYVSPSFSWRLEIPPHMDLEMLSHNGNLQVKDVEGKLVAETHNGGVDAKLRTGNLEIETHNGDVSVAVEGSGPLQGTMVSHNGGMDLTVGANRGTTIEADTHNGRIKVAHEGASFSKDRTTARLRLGDGSGKLAVTTHNGSIDIR